MKSLSSFVITIVVLYFEAFQDEIRNQQEWNEGDQSKNGAGRDNGEASRRQMRVSVAEDRKGPQRTPLTVADEKDSGFVVPVKDGGKLCVVRGDITKETTDVIAHLSNPEGSMNGGVAKALVKAGGREIERDRSKKGTVRMYETVLTCAGKLRAKYVAHMSGPSNLDSQDIKKCLQDCFENVKKQQCTSISIPAIGTGVLGTS